MITPSSIEVLTYLLLVARLVHGFSVVIQRVLVLREARVEQRWMKMDDEKARATCKTDITARDDNYLSTRFSKLSSSGHDLTPMTSEEIDAELKHLSSEGCFTEYQHGMKGIFVGFISFSKVGGLPLFSTGYLLTEDSQNGYMNMLSFSEPCDEEHIVVMSNRKVNCVRSGITVGELALKNGSNIYLVEKDKTVFLPGDMPWPQRSQPENYWGTEGQFVAWNDNDMAKKPLSY